MRSSHSRGRAWWVFCGVAVLLVVRLLLRMVLEAAAGNSVIFTELTLFVIHWTAPLILFVIAFWLRKVEMQR